MFGKGQGMGPGRGQSMGQAGSGRPGATAITTGKGYHVIPPKSGRGAKLPVVPGTVPANTGGTFGRLFGGGRHAAAENLPADLSPLRMRLHDQLLAVSG